jgi:PAS domain-containing protein
MPKRISRRDPTPSGVYFSSRADADYAQRVRRASARVRELRQRAQAQGSTTPDLQEALDELELAHDALRAAQDELFQRADQLLTARLEHELQWMRYRDLFESAPLAYLETDLGGMVVEANRRCLELLGGTHNLIVGKSVLLFVASSDRPHLRAALVRLRERGGTSTLRLQLSPRPPHALVSVRLDVACATDRQGRLGALRCIFSHEPAPSGNGTGDTPSAPRLTDIVPRAPLGSSSSDSSAPRSPRRTRRQPCK